MLGAGLHMLCGSAFFAEPETSWLLTQKKLNDI